ncbi:MAG: hypothetical protein CMN02_05945 [Roseibacillus sp.]|nr:hypothetical protein [Roseibacillus sp.]
MAYPSSPLPAAPSADESPSLPKSELGDSQELYRLSSGRILHSWMPAETLGCSRASNLIRSK